MAHESVVSLNLVIESFLNIPYRDKFLPNPETELVHQEVWSLKSILELDHFEESERLNAFKGEILEAIPKFKDLLEDHINKCQLHFSGSQSLDDESQSLDDGILIINKCFFVEMMKNIKQEIEDYIKKCFGGGSSNEFRDVPDGHKNKCQRQFLESQILSEDVEKVKEEMISIMETMKKIIKEYNGKLDLETNNKESPLDHEDFGRNVDVEGVNDEDVQELMGKLTGQSSKINIISVVGTAGIGKTTIVEALYNDPFISDDFDTSAFLRVGPNSHPKKILLDLLICLSPNYNKILGIEKSEEDLKGQIYECVKYKRYLIVLDDVWDSGLTEIVKWSLPQNHNRSRIIVTTRMLRVVPDYSSSRNVHVVRFRNEKESWNLFCKKIVVPPELEKVGKKIVKKCGGLPLGIISIASILSKAEKSLEYWEKVAKNENMLALATKEGSHMSNVLFLSYKHLPPHLKECCLYFGVFPLNYEISVSKLVKLWVGEGLIVPHHFRTFEDTAREYLEDLVSRNIVLTSQRSSSGRVKTVKAHYFWDLWVREAAKKKIFHLINSYDSAFSEGMHYQRRLCIHKNALLGFKCVYKSLESVSNVRSFLCTGPEHQYPVSICSRLTSTKVLDALTIRLYKFPIEILEQVELKYIAFTYDGKLNSSIYRLKNLVYMIVHRYHLTIINSSPSYMPIEIWNMQELRHLQVMGSDLPHPVGGSQLPNLLTLLGVSDRSCTKEVFQSIPNLKKLGVQIVLPLDVFETLDIFDHLALLSRLKSFKCIVLNPNPRSQRVHLLPNSVFPDSLTKLTLSGCGFAWHHMSMIGPALPNLEVLKLRCYAFQGPEWVVDEKEFPNLEHLLLEDTDLVHWKVGYGCFPHLKRLIIRHCYKLQEIPCMYGNPMIELVDCSPSALASVKHILEKQSEHGNDELRIQVYSSLDDEKH